MKKIPTLSLFFLTSFVLLSSFAFAQSSMNVSSGIDNLGGLISRITGSVVKSLGQLFMAGAMVVFFYGIVQYIWGLRQGDSGKTKIGNSFMIWGLVALFVMFSVYGIVKLAQSTICPGCDFSTITVPEINFGKGGSTNNTLPNKDNVLAPAQQVYTCPDGVTKYYNLSDRNVICSNARAPSASSRGSSAGADCSVNQSNSSECGGRACVNYKCQ
jgi:hypothetical protein